jgi:hypothetical protein
MKPSMSPSFQAFACVWRTVAISEVGDASTKQGRAANNRTGSSLFMRRANAAAAKRASGFQRTSPPASSIGSGV